MIRVRDDQVAALDAAVKERSYRRIAALMRERLPRELFPAGEEALLARIRLSAKAAGGYSILSEQGIARFATMSLLFGESFHRQPAIHRALEGGGKKAERALEWLFNEAAREMGRQAREEAK
jgi:hypothetical protein